MRSSFAIPLLCLIAANAAGTEKQRAYLEELRGILPKSEAWESWLAHTGELPPDFDALPSVQSIPNPLEHGPAGVIENAQEWSAQGQALKDLFHHWIIGTVPPPPSDFDAETIVIESNDSVEVSEVTLRFGPQHQAKLWMQIAIPEGEGPFPVFLTQDNHAQWANVALRRGYITCVYAGADSRDDTATFINAYPDYDWSKLARRAWAASRCIDYLLTLPQVNAEQIAITGHSRNGKLSLIAAALDERIACVISSSSGAGGSLSARYYGEHYFGEGIENITRQFPDWFHPRLRFFAGREDKLPVDFNQLVALSAPRPCLLSIAVNDNVESTWAMQHTYDSVKPVYALFDATDNLRILWRAGSHETWPTIIERYIDWCDLQFGRGKADFPERFVYPRDWEAWNRNVSADLPEQTGDVADRVRAMVGDAPGKSEYEPGDYGLHKSHEAVMLRRDEAGPGLDMQRITFGEYINGDCYFPANTDEPRPAILWLPSLCPSTGYVPAYRRGEHPHRSFARAGYAVFAYDPIGTGRRAEETENFYARYPGWSLLGKMLRDAQAALDAMEQLPQVDSSRIYVVGYHVGAFVAAHLAAVDSRPAGYALVSPPARFSSSEFATGLWSRELMLLPQLGRAGQSTYDVPDLLASIAPRPLLLLTPKLDRHCPPAEADVLFSAVQSVYESQDKLTRRSPRAYNHFDQSIQNIVVQWLNGL